MMPTALPDPTSSFERTRALARPRRLGVGAAARALAVLAVAVLVLGVAVASEHAGDASQSLPDVIHAQPELSILSEILEASGLAERLADAGAITIFAPTDAAFEALGEAQLTLLRDNPGMLNLFLRDHMVNAVVPSSALSRSPTFSTLQGSELMVDAHGDRILVDGAHVIMTDVRARNGIIHVIDQVLSPRADFPNKNQSSIPIGGHGGGTGRSGE